MKGSSVYFFAPRDVRKLTCPTAKFQEDFEKSPGEVIVYDVWSQLLDKIGQRVLSGGNKAINLSKQYTFGCGRRTPMADQWVRNLLGG